MTMTKKATNLKICLSSILVVLLLVPTLAWGHCTCDIQAQHQHKSRSESLTYKLIAIASILIAGTVGVGLPQFGRKFEALRPESDIFFMVKAFAAGVILATGYIHILPDAFNSLTSPCLKETLWRDFPFTGLVAMMSSIGTLMVDSFATGYYKRLHFNNNSNKTHQEVIHGDEEIRVIVGEEHQGHVHIHTHATHGHAHGSSTNIPSSGHHEIVTLDLIRHRIISQVLELGIVVHSVIIGISLGACQNPQVIKPLLAALSFHQFFEGMGLGGCISQAKFESLSTAIMVLFFSLTAPAGIAIGIAVSSVYKEDSPTALIVEGIFYSAAAGILIYMALVDLLAADFMNPRMQDNGRLQLGAYISLLLGAGCMSVLAKWT
ncbi:hypothetical protein RHSIM_Rhsim06G0243600 [Rhododendron simsii]|uniref:Uncharacterized protein n=1 Tax=Rhododendron simsii TaxID=118357 RepID=A0A834GW36_RHOSS|nr:hypothetical protein RHSIM_Rhsim06G0243600 [Rhododendron simsii]